MNSVVTKAFFNRLISCLLFFGVYSFNAPVWAQNQLLIDSLTNILEQDINSLERIDMYVMIADEYAKSDSANTHLYVNKALDLAKELRYQKGILDALNTLGTLAIQLGKYDHAIDQFESILDSAEVVNYPVGKAKAFRGLGNVYDFKGEYEKAFDYFSQSHELFEEAGDESNDALTISFMSGVKRMQGDYTAALDYGLKSISMYEKLNNTPGLGLVLNDVGLIYWNLGELDNAIEYFGKSIAIHEILQDKRSIAYTTANIGIIYNEQGDQEASLANYNRSLDLLYELDDIRALGIILYNVSVINMDLKNFDLSLKQANESLAIREKLGVESEKAFPILGIARTYMNMKDYVKSQKYAKEGHQIAKKFGMRRLEMEALATLSFVENELGNYKAAFDSHVRFKNLTDSLRNAENTREISRLEAEFEFQKEKDSIQFENEKSLLAKNTEIDLLNEKEKVARLQLLGLVGLSVIIIGIGYWVARSKVRAKEYQANALKEIGSFKESMTGMIAHDIKNPLSIILNSEDEKVSKEMAARILRLINNMLDVHRFESTNVPLQLETIETGELLDFVLPQVKPLVLEKNLRIEQEIEEGHVEIDREIIARVLINLLTNAIKYSPANGTINLVVAQQNEEMIFSVVDEGKGISKEEQQIIFESFGQADPRVSGGVRSTGLGLTFVKMALEAHQSKIEMVSEVGSGSTFSFRLPSSVATDKKIRSNLSIDFTALSNQDRRLIANQITSLKKLNVHQIGEIEKELEQLKEKENDKIKEWVNAILNAAYTGNSQGYSELINQIDNKED